MNKISRNFVKNNTIFHLLFLLLYVRFISVLFDKFVFPNAVAVPSTSADADGGQDACQQQQQQQQQQLQQILDSLDNFLLWVKEQAAVNDLDHKRAGRRAYCYCENLTQTQSEAVEARA